MTITAPQETENQWVLEGADVSQKFFEFQKLAVKSIEQCKQSLVFETAIYETM